jgi:hypothetical protein
MEAGRNAFGRRMGILRSHEKGDGLVLADPWSFGQASHDRWLTIPALSHLTRRRTECCGLDRRSYRLSLAQNLHYRPPLLRQEAEAAAR